MGADSVIRLLCLSSVTFLRVSWIGLYLHDSSLSHCGTCVGIYMEYSLEFEHNSQGSDVHVHLALTAVVHAAAAVVAEVADDGQCYRHLFAWAQTMAGRCMSKL